MKKLFLILLFTILSLNLVSSIFINSLNAPNINPGEEGIIEISIENNLDRDAEDVSIELDFSLIPLIPVGSSQQSEEEIDEDDDEDFVFTVRAANDIIPGNYEIPYLIRYFEKGDDKEFDKRGTIGITVSANPKISFSAMAQDAVIGQEGTINLKIINKGFSDARFVSIKIFAEDFALLSDPEDYIGTVDSDDFETTSFDVIFTKTKPNLRGILEYKNFENELVIEEMLIPLNVYSVEEATELGIIKPSKINSIISTIIIVVILFFILRWYRKRKRIKKSSMHNR